MPISTTITFPDGSEIGSTSCGLVVIVNDDIPEFTEFFFVTLESTDETLATISESTTMVSIVNDDCKIVCLNYSRKLARVML